MQAHAPEDIPEILEKNMMKCGNLVISSENVCETFLLNVRPWPTMARCCIVVALCWVHFEGIRQGLADSTLDMTSWRETQKKKRKSHCVSHTHPSAPPDHARGKGSAAWRGLGRTYWMSGGAGALWGFNSPSHHTRTTFFCSWSTPPGSLSSRSFNALSCARAR